jgi:hypothetical protein
LRCRAIILVTAATGDAGHRQDGGQDNETVPHGFPSSAFPFGGDTV